MQNLKNKYYGIFIALPILTLFWFILFLMLDSKIVQSPFDVFAQIPVFLSNKETYIHLYFSLSRIFLGILFSLLIGTFFGVLMGLNKKFDNIFTPILYLTYPVPKLSLLPIVVLTLGIGEISKIVMIVLIIVFQIITSIRSAIINIPPNNFHFLKVIGVSKLKVFYVVILPIIAKQIFVSLKIAVGTGISVLFFTENFGTKYGLGYYIMDCFQMANYLNMYTGIVILSSIGFILFVFVDFLEHYFTPWSY